MIKTPQPFLQKNGRWYYGFVEVKIPQSVEDVASMTRNMEEFINTITSRAESWGHNVIVEEAKVSDGHIRLVGYAFKTVQEKSVLKTFEGMGDSTLPLMSKEEKTLLLENREIHQRVINRILSSSGNSESQNISKTQLKRVLSKAKIKILQ